MKRDHIDRVFGRSRLQMVTGSHVEVFREATPPGERRRYTKRFLLTEGGDFRHWTEREWRILARLVGHGITSVPEVAQFDRGGPDRPALVQTYDAGITVDHWATLLPVQRDGRLLRHVFEDCAHWWALARHCLVALDAIHALDLLHLDLKADNVCIPLAPEGFAPSVAGQTLQPAFEQLALIDFAFSLVSGDELATALPIGQQPDDDYQSPRLLHALEAGRFGDLLPMRQLDWRCDLYSLAAMLARYMPRAGSAAAPGWKDWRHAQARVLLRRLADAHDQAAPTQRPHQELIAMTRLALSDPELVDSLRRGWLLAPEGAIDDAELPTPVTRLAMPLIAPVSPVHRIEPVPAVPMLSPMRADPRPLPGAARPRSRSPLIWTAAAVGAAAMVASVPLLGDVWLSLRDVGSVTLARSGTPPAETPPPVAAAPIDIPPAGPASGASAIAATAAPMPVPAAPGVSTAATESPAATAPAVAAAAAKMAAPSAVPVVPTASLPKRAARGAVPTSVHASPVAPGRPAAGASRAPTVKPRPVAVAGVAAAPKVTPKAVPKPSPKPAPTTPPVTTASDAKAAEAARAYVMAALARERPSRSTSARAAAPAVPVAAATPLPSTASVAPPAAETSGATAPTTPPPPMAPPAPEPVRTVPPPPRTAAAAALPQDFTARADVLMVDYLPQIAQRAERVIGNLLQTASRRDASPQDDTVLQAVRASKLTPDRTLAGLDVSASDAQQLNDAARAAFAKGGGLGRALNLQTRAFGANPQDVEVVGNLAYFHLVENSDWPETARRLALHALTIPDARYPTGRLRDWTTFAFASALSGHERDARDALFVSLAVTADIDRLCRSAVDAYEAHGERLRGPVQAMMKRIRLWGLAPQSTSCRMPWNAAGGINAR